MQPDEYREAIKALGYTQEGFAELLGAKPRTGQYWASVAVPAPVAMIIRLIQARPEVRTVIEDLAARPRKAKNSK
jgi:DNA-binding transcriptional regulator YiaG